MSAKWEIVSGFLGLSISVIDNIKATPPVTTVGCWHEALKNWIKQNYNTGKHALPSWRSLLAAVARVDRLLFKKLAAAHPGEEMYKPWIGCCFIFIEAVLAQKYPTILTCTSIISVR